MNEVATIREVPRFSMAERDLRWGRVRKLMERDRLDVIVVPRHAGNWDVGNANARYLTGIGGNGSGCAVVFPREGEVTAIVGPVPSIEHWLAFQDWVKDIRMAGRNMSLSQGNSGAGGHRYGGAIVERLKELGIEHGRIGIAGLTGTTRSPEGIVPHGAFVRISEAFPNAEIVDAGDLLDEAKVLKSAEEIAFLERADALAEGAFEVLLREARPGVPHSVVYIHMLANMVENGGEIPAMLLWSAGNPQPSRNVMMPTPQKLQAGDIIGVEIDGNYSGYRSQFSSNAVLGKLPADYTDMFKVQQDALQRCYQQIRPGVRLGDLTEGSIQAAKGTPYTCQLIMHGRGLGDDGPMIVFGTQDKKVLNWTIEENNAFIVKPVVWLHDWEKWVCWGDSIVVTSDGSRRLGKRPAEITEIT